MSGLPDLSSDAQLIRDVLIAASNHEGRTVGWLLKRGEALHAVDRLERAAEREQERVRLTIREKGELRS